MATKTSNYGLTKPSETDFYNIKDFNDNADIIDEKLKENADAAAYYGTCSTANETAAKKVTCAGFALKAGARIVVTFTYGNSAASPTLNVNGTGTYDILKDSVIPCDRVWRAGTTIEFVYTDFTWMMVSAPMELYNGVDSASTTQAPTANAVRTAYNMATAALRSATFYGKSNSGSSYAAKVVSCPNFTLSIGTRIAVTFDAALAVNYPTLNVNGTGAIPIYKDGELARSGAWVSGATIDFIYDGEYWRMIS